MRAKLKAVSKPGGIILENVNGENWINPVNEEYKEDVQSNVEEYKKYVGYIIDVDLDETKKFFKSLNFDNAETQSNKSDDDGYVVYIKGKEYVTYKGLIKKAFEKGLIRFEILSEFVSEDMKRAWVKVRAYYTEGSFFDGIGSSTPENTGGMTSDHPIEMAHTRAKGRALRDFLGEGKAMVEELKKEDKGE